MIEPVRQATDDVTRLVVKIATIHKHWNDLAQSKLLPSELRKGIALFW